MFIEGEKEILKIIEIFSNERLEFIAGDKIQEMFADDVVSLVEKCYREPWKMDIGQVMWYGAKVKDKPNYGKNSRNTALKPIVLTLVSKQDLETRYKPDRKATRNRI